MLYDVREEGTVGCVVLQREWTLDGVVVERGSLKYTAGCIHTRILPGWLAGWLAYLLLPRLNLEKMGKKFWPANIKNITRHETNTQTHCVLFFLTLVSSLTFICTDTYTLRIFLLLLPIQQATV